jgi:DNA uptake protein ComE-like DNA-binding protein
MHNRLVVTTALLLCLGGLACSNDPKTTREQAKNATEDIKRESREAAGNIKKGAETARTALTAAGEGVKEGLNDKSSSQVNLNTANKPQLMGLPGINERSADAIIANRPYSEPRELVSKRAISEDEFQKISSQVTTKTPKQ